MDIIYILGKGSLFNNLELRYSLHTVNRFTKGVDNIYIIGEHPGFEGNFTHIYHPDNGLNKHDNIRRKIARACEIPELSTSFLFMNDDHFFAQETDINYFPYYYNTTIEHAYRLRKISGTYKTSMANTLGLLPDGLYFDVHTPIIINKHLFPQITEKVNWQNQGHLVKSLYANQSPQCIKKVQMPDPIINTIMTEDHIKSFISDKQTWAVGNGGMDDNMARFMEGELK